ARRPVSSPATNPKLQTEVASGIGDPAPCTRSQTATLAAIKQKVAIGVRRLTFSSRYGNIGHLPAAGGETIFSPHRHLWRLSAPSPCFKVISRGVLFSAPVASGISGLSILWTRERVVEKGGT